MTCEVGSRVSNGRGKVARNVQTLHSLPPCLSSPHSCPSLSLSLPFTCSSLTSSLHPLFMRFFISLAFLRQNVMANCHLRSEMSLSLSLSFAPSPHPMLSFFVFFQVLLVPYRAESGKQSRDQLTGKNGKHLYTELRRENKRTIRWSLCFSGHKMRIINFRTRT